MWYYTLKRPPMNLQIIKHTSQQSIISFKIQKSKLFRIFATIYFKEPISRITQISIHKHKFAILKTWIQSYHACLPLPWILQNRRNTKPPGARQVILGIFSSLTYHYHHHFYPIILLFSVENTVRGDAIANDTQNWPIKETVSAAFVCLVRTKRVSQAPAQWIFIIFPAL